MVAAKVGEEARREREDVIGMLLAQARADGKTRAKPERD
jgi:hypothetical protein